MELNAGRPTALGKKRLRVGHFQNFAKRAAFIGRALVIRLDDAISDPIAEVARLLRCAVVKPFGEVGLVHVRDEGGFDFLFTPPWSTL